MTDEAFETRKSKKKKSSKSPERTYSLDEFDAATLAQFQNGTLRGYSDAHILIDATLRRLRQSLEDVWAIEYEGPITPKKNETADKLTFAISTLETARDMIADAIDHTISELRADGADITDDEEDLGFMPEEFLKHLEDLDNE